MKKTEREYEKSEERKSQFWFLIFFGSLVVMLSVMLMFWTSNIDDSINDVFGHLLNVLLESYEAVKFKLISFFQFMLKK